MLVLACGSRTWGSEATIRDRFLSLLEVVRPRVMHGGAHGADRLVDKVCQELGIERRVFLPEWGVYGRAAGIRRNLVMLDEKPDLVLAFWDEQSPGTRYTVREAERRKIAVEIIAMTRK